MSENSDSLVSESIRRLRSASRMSASKCFVTRLGNRLAISILFPFFQFVDQPASLDSTCVNPASRDCAIGVGAVNEKSDGAGLCQPCGIAQHPHNRFEAAGQSNTTTPLRCSVSDNGCRNPTWSRLTHLLDPSGSQIYHQSKCATDWDGGKVQSVRHSRMDSAG